LKIPTRTDRVLTLKGVGEGLLNQRLVELVLGTEGDHLVGTPVGLDLHDTVNLSLVLYRQTVVSFVATKAATASSVGFSLLMEPLAHCHKYECVVL